jgi:ornithine carbamoyltransferase
MLKLQTKHLKTGEELTPDEILALIDCAIALKQERNQQQFGHKWTCPREPLKGMHLALLFDKPSLRTRFSFMVAVRELGGSTIESVGSTRKDEEPEDLAQVLGGYCHGIIVRTHQDSFIERMTDKSTVPVINGLSELHHPCQILADLMTIKENFQILKGITLSYVGDGNNILHSLLLLAPPLGVSIRYSCPKKYQPDSMILKEAKRRALPSGGQITQCATPSEAVQHAHAVYTDVWTSMGFESEKIEREAAFSDYQINEELMSKAGKNTVIMHCLPMMRGKEISTTLPNHKNSVIFQQSENRLHIQKALLIGLLTSRVE